MNPEPHWLDAVDVLAFHEDLLSRFGGSAGIRDRGLMESALNRPVQLFHYGTPSMFEMAAAYGAGIVKNHPFVDGNKRTGFIAAALFLELNGYHFGSTEEEAVERTLALAAGAIEEADYAAWLERTSIPASDEDESGD
ncbi:MAG: type II toxin-antitoxin system death-on-curing family toxin [Verrucomicrobiae bacterium]|nr:type II toxin-antitoxin system death-on-curing family toxin [Verrucomicrobiae bacterium]